MPVGSSDDVKAILRPSAGNCMPVIVKMAEKRFCEVREVYYLRGTLLTQKAYSQITVYKPHTAIFIFQWRI